MFPFPVGILFQDISNYTGLIGPKIVLSGFIISLIQLIFKMKMTSRAKKYCLAGCMWPVGRGLESPDLQCCHAPLRCHWCATTGACAASWWESLDYSAFCTTWIWTGRVIHTNVDLTVRGQLDLLLTQTLHLLIWNDLVTITFNSVLESALMIISVLMIDGIRRSQFLRLRNDHRSIEKKKKKVKKKISSTGSWKYSV